MKIPILNLYYLLCYAWDRLEEGGLVEAGTEDYSNALDLFARVLANGIEAILARGLDRDYVPIEEDVAGVRGRIHFPETLSRNLLRSARTHSQYDDLSYDVLHNQILKATISRLLKAPSLARELRGELAALIRRLNGIADIQLSLATFRRVRIHRNNHLYDFLLRVCHLIESRFSVDQSNGRLVFRDFERDEEAMAGVFQEFVCNFYKKEQAKYRVRSLQVRWKAGGDENALAHLPVMQTDIALMSPDKTVVIDTKYYQEALPAHFGQPKVRSEHLYQLLAYLTNLAGTRDCQGRPRGILLYPTVERSFSLDYELNGFSVAIRTVDLNQPWRQIRDSLLNLSV